MSRPISWLPRLHQITRTVANSARSHYDRRDLEALFELQPRAAQKLLEILPTVHIGTSHLVERETLAAFLDRVHKAPNPTTLLAQIRTEHPRKTPRKRLRSLVRRDVAPATLSTLPAAIALTPGHMHVTFATVEQLAEAMLTLARILEFEGETFAQLYEPRTPNPEATIDATTAAEIDLLFASLNPR